MNVFRKGERLDEGDLAYTALLVLEAQDADVQRYTYLRQQLRRLNYDFGDGDEEARVKDLVHRATVKGYLAPATPGRGPRKPGPALSGLAIVRGGDVRVVSTRADVTGGER